MEMLSEEKYENLEGFESSSREKKDEIIITTLPYGDNSISKLPQFDVSLLLTAMDDIAADMHSSWKFSL